MLSKNNYKERIRKMEEQKERFSIRKLSVGTASVLIGLFLTGIGAQKADAATINANKEVTEENPTHNDSASSSEDVNSKVLDVKPASQATTLSIKSNAEESVSSAVSEKASSSVATTLNTQSSSSDYLTSLASNAAVNSDAKDAILSVKSDAKSPVLTTASNAKSLSDLDETLNSMAAKGAAVGKNDKGVYAALDDTQGQVVAVSNWNEFADAWNNATVTQIDLSGDINVDDSSNVTKKPQPVVAKHKLEFTGNNISRKLTINGDKGKYSINFGDWYFDNSWENKVGLIHTNGNRSMKTPWDVTFNGVNINANKTNPFGFSGNTNNAPSGDAYDNTKYDKVTFNNVTANIKEGSLIDSDNVNVQFSGNNVINLQSIQNKVGGIDANSMKVVNGTTFINAASEDKTGGGVIDGEGMNVIMVTPHNTSDFSDPKTAYDSLHVAEGSTLTINADTKDQDGNLINKDITNQYDLRGIVTRPTSGVNATAWSQGTLTIDGNLNETLGSGHSSAIMARNLTINKTGNVNILTQQDNEHDGFEDSIVGAASVFNGFHAGVIALNVGGIQSSNLQAHDSSLIDNGTLKIVRKDVPANNKAKGSVWAPLIVFGTYGNNPVKYTMNVGEGATLDLQDQATFVRPALYSGKVMTNTPFAGLINMYGVDSNDVLSFTKPAYVNLQRTGEQTGTLVRLEGNNDSKNAGNTIQLNGVTPGGTPLSQWDTGNYTSNPSNTWRIQNLTAHDAKGMNAILGYETVKDSKDNHTLKFLDSNGAVTLTMDKTGKVVYTRNGDGQVVSDPQGTTAQEVQLNNFLNNFNFWTPQRISFGNKAAVSQSIYAPTDVKEGTTKTVMPNVFNKPADTPEQDQIKTTYAKTADTPAWVSVDENTGELTLVPTVDNSKVGMYNVPVQVTDTDQTNSGETTTRTVLAPVYVTDGNEAVNWIKDPEGNLNGAIVVTTDPSVLKVHETSDNNMDLKAVDAIKSIDEYQMDTVNTISTTPTSIAKDANGVSIAWGTEPSTVVGTASKSKDVKGVVKVTFAKDSQPFTDSVLDQDKDYTENADVNVEAPGAVAQEKAPATPVSAKVGAKLTDDQFKALVNNFVPAKEVAYETLQSVDKEDNAVVRITFNDKDAKGQNTYLDIKVPASYVNTTTDANEYQPSYKPVNVKQGESIETGVPTYTDADGKTAKAPEGTIYNIPEGTKLPEGVTAKVDPNTGNVTVTTSSNTPEGPVFVPVTVTYPDKSTETIYAPIAVGPNTFIGTNYSFMVTGSLKNLHETTQNSMYVDPAKTITKIVWWNNKDLVDSELTGKGAVQHEITDFTDMTAEWTNPLNTNVKSASLEETLATTPAIKLTFGPNSQLMKETGTNLFSTPEHTMSVSWYDSKAQGAAPVADAASKKAEVKPAKAGDKLTDAEVALIDTTNLNKLTANKPVSYTWANDLKAGDTQGTVRITFQDKDKNGQLTYLDVELPAGSINVTKEQTRKINFVDPDGKTVSTQTLTGKTGTSVTIGNGTGETPLEVPTGYEIVPNTEIPTTVPFNADSKDNPDITVKVQAKIDTVDGRKDKSNSDVYREVTRTITVNIEGQEPQVRTQTLDFYRIKSTNEATGKVTYTDWTSNMADGSTSFPDFEIPTAGGYTRTITGGTITTKDGKDYVASVSGLNNGTPVNNINVTVNYTKAEQTATIQYVVNNDHNHVVGTQEVSGEIGETVKVNLEVPTNWKLVPNQQVPDEFTFGSTSIKDTIVYVEHSTKDVTSDYENDKNVETATKWTVTETINVTTPDGKTTKAVDASKTFTRTATKDLVTNKVTYGEWSDNGSYTFPSYNVKEIAGYTPSQASVAAQTVKPGDKDLVFNITYSANSETRKINFVNPDGKTVSTQTLTGKAGTTITIGNGSGETPLEVPTGYEIVPNTQVPTTVPFNATDNPDITIKVQAKVNTDDGRNDESNSDVYRQVTETVTVNIEGQKPQVVTQTRDFYRIKSTNEATGKVTYTDWTSNMTDKSTSFAPVEIPSAAGYTRTITGGTITTKDGKDYVAAQSGLENGTPVNNINVTVNYIYSDQTATIKFVNNADHNDVVSTQVVGGKTGQTVPVTLEVPANWQVVGGQQIPSSFTFGSEPIKDTIVYVEHKTEDVTKDPSQKDNVNKTIIRTIDVDVAGKTSEYTKQTVTLHRTATKDLVTNKVSYGAWNTVKFDAVTAPAEPGYTVTNPDAAPALAVTDTTENSTVTFNYTANKHSVTITYVDNSDKTVGSYTETGTTGETVNLEINTHVPNGYHITDETVPGQITFGSNDPVPITVHVEKNVNPTDADKYTPEPKDIHTQVGKEPTPEEGIGNIPSLPSGTTYTWTNGVPDVTTPGTKSTEITVHYPDGTTDTVTTKVIVEEPTKNPTDADKYTPEPKDIHTQVGKEPTPEEGIGNIPSLPSGTTYTWTNGAPDVTNPGTKSTEITVHYPDGTTDTVTTKVIVEEPTKNPTDADKYTPEPKDIHTQVGKEPTPEEGIANIPNLPSGTTYTWTNGAPDVTNPGTKSTEITVHYPDGTTDTVTTKVIVEEPTKNPTDADKYTPEGQSINTKEGQVPNPADGIKNKTDMPEGTKYTWKDTPEVTTPGSHDATIVVTYPDGSKDEVPTTVNVPTPEGQSINTPYGVVPNPVEGIKNKTDMPEGTKYSWKDTPDVTIPGSHDATVVVTYPDGKTSEIPVTIIVGKSDADKYTPEGQDVPAIIGTIPSSVEGIKNKNDMPEGTKYSWKDTPDVTTPGSHDAIVVVTYPDSSKDEVSVKVVVTSPEGQIVSTTTGVVPNPADGIKNKTDMPEGTKYTWKDTPDVTTPGSHDATIVVTLPGGKTVEVPVKVDVTDNTPSTPVATPTDADLYTPEGQDVHTNEGVTPDPVDGIKNKTDMPEGTKYTWKDTPDVTTPGKHDATVVVTYPDGSQDEVSVKIIVTSPEGQDVHTNEGVTPDPADGIKNKTDMPEGTKYTWKDTPDVTTPGKHDATIVVTLPNGKTVEVPVKVIVDKDEEINPIPEGQRIHTSQGTLPDPANGIKNKDDMPEGTEYSWKKEPDVKTTGKHKGIIRVTFPNGETVDVPVSVVVSPKSDRNDIAGVHGGDNESGNSGSGKTSTNIIGVKGIYENRITGNSKESDRSSDADKDYLDSYARTLPQTGANDGAAAMLGIIIVSVGAIMGMAVEKKRRN